MSHRRAIGCRNLLGCGLLASLASGCGATREERSALGPAGVRRDAARGATVVQGPATEASFPLPAAARDDAGWYAMTPERPHNGIAVHDPIAGRAVVIDESCWLWRRKAGRWVRERRLADDVWRPSLAYFDPRRRSIVIGYRDDGAPDDPSGRRRPKAGWSFFTADQPERRWRVPLPVDPLGATWAHDDARDRLVVAANNGDEVYSVRGERVTRVARSAAAISDVAYEPATRRIVAIGTFSDGHGRGSSELLTLDANGWRRLGEQPRWTGSRLGYDPASGRLLQFRADGRDDPAGGMVLFELRGDRWTRREPPRRTLLTAASALVADGDDLLLHGGQDFRAGAAWSDRTWVCRAARCEESLTRFELPEPGAHASLFSGAGGPMYVNHVTLAIWQLSTTGWRRWGPTAELAGELRSPADALRPEGSEIPMPLAVSSGPSGVHLLDRDAGLWRARADRAISPRAPAVRHVADRGQVELTEEPATGRLVVGVVGPARSDETVGAIWGFDDGRWIRLEDVPGLVALASGPSAVHALTSSHRLFSLSGSRWNEVRNLADPGRVASGLIVATDGRLFARLGEEVLAEIGLDRYRELFAIPTGCADDPQVALDLEARRWLVRCGDALYARAFEPT